MLHIQKGIPYIATAIAEEEWNIPKCIELQEIFEKYQIDSSIRGVV